MHRPATLTSALAAAALLAAATGGAAAAAVAVADADSGTAADGAPRPSAERTSAADGHGHDHARPGAVVSPDGDTRRASFDLVRTVVRRDGQSLVFVEEVSRKAGAAVPTATGSFAGSAVWSYVWPTTLDPYAVGFRRGSGVLALAATSHPDFDDTPLYDEDGDGATDNDGRRWHAHWVVLVPDTTRADGALKVRDIPAGATPRLPRTWPGAPVYLDSPDYPTRVGRDAVRIRVPLEDVGGSTRFGYDGVTAALRVSADLHDPLLRVTNVFDVASGDLSLPGSVVRD